MIQRGNLRVIVVTVPLRKSPKYETMPPQPFELVKAELSSVVVDREFRVVDAEEVDRHGMEVVAIRRTLSRLEAEFIARAL